MTLTITRGVRAVGLVVAMFGLVAAGLLLTVAKPAGAGTSIPTLDHFLCYQSRVAGIKAPPGIQLFNQVQPAPFTPNIGAGQWHCNPANKSVPVALFRAKNPLAHLFCFNLSFKMASVELNLSNQFGKAIMLAQSPTRLCLPSWKSNIGPPNLAVNQPPGLDHFTCYPVTAIPGAYGFKAPSFVKSEDEFSAPKYVPLKLSTANLECVPTNKILPSGFVYKTQGPNDLWLTCFPTSPTPIWKTVYDQNQFGEATVYPTTPKEEFCLPTTGSVVAPAA